MDTVSGTVILEGYGPSDLIARVRQADWKKTFPVGKDFTRVSLAGARLSDTPDALCPVKFRLTWGAGVERAAKDFDGWVASAHYRTADQVISALGRYRQAGGKRAIVSTIQLSADHDLGQTKEILQRFAEAGFDDAVVLLRPGGPSPVEVRALLD